MSSSSIDQSLSLYIPRVTRRMTAKFITETIETMRLGKVDRVDMAETADKRQMTAYVHFAKWEETSANVQLQRRIKDPNQQARIVYDAPWYWILLVNNNPEPAIDVEEEEVVAPTTPPQQTTPNPVNAQNTFASVLRRTTICAPTLIDTSHVSIDTEFPPMMAPRQLATHNQQKPSAQDIAEMTQMAMDCDEEWNDTLREQEMVRDQGADTDESYTQRLNQELQVIIGDLQARLAWCEQMSVNTAFRVETANDAIASLGATNHHTNTRVGYAEMRLVDVEYAVWGGDDAAEVTDTEE